jgi:diguanylate cyclase (GGDEF)-like protein
MPILEAVASVLDGTYDLKNLKSQLKQFEASSLKYEYSQADALMYISWIYHLLRDWGGLKKIAARLIKFQEGKGRVLDTQAAYQLKKTAHFKLGEYKQAYACLNSQFELYRQSSTDRVNRIKESMTATFELEKSKIEQSALRLRNQFLAKRNMELETIAKVDLLSGTLNRRGTEEQLTHEVSSGSYEKLGIALLDIDRFKTINDKYGHALGDKVISAFAQSLKEFDSAVHIGRWGGEEFLVVFRAASQQQLTEIGEAMLDHIQAYNWQALTGIPKVSASIGLALWRTGQDIYDTIKIADLNLYEAKHSGRNRICSRPFIERRKAA